MANLTIIDGHNYLFRAFYGVPMAAQTRRGTRVNAVYGFFAFLRQIVAAYPNNKILVVFDSETGIADKITMHSEYKAARTIDTDMFKQLPYIKKILDLMHIKWIEHPGFEADDIIASMAIYWSEKFGLVNISSNDFDFVQMVSESISLIRSVQGKLINCDVNFVREKFNVIPAQYVEYLSLVGDKTDNIRGVMGIGNKTASDLLTRYGTLDDIYANIPVQSAGIQKRLLSGKETAYNNREFITMRRNIPIGKIMSAPLLDTDVERIQIKIAIFLDKIGL